MELWTAFILGLVGSLHCAGMCGPLVLALPTTGGATSSGLFGRSLYNLGRIITYCILGAVFGLIGHTLSLAGFQRWLSLGAGAAILIGLAASSRYALNTPVTRAAAGLKSGFAKLLPKHTHVSIVFLGLLNGLLPCGLVYAACAGAVAAGGFIASVEYMLAFGLGTVPMMLGIGFVGRKIQVAIRFKLQKLIPISLVLVGALLILRGLSLGIPFLSPSLSGASGQCSACH
jgi:uncharacterized protein